MTQNTPNFDAWVALPPSDERDDHISQWIEAQYASHKSTENTARIPLAIIYEVLGYTAMSDLTDPFRHMDNVFSSRLIQHKLPDKYNIDQFIQVVRDLGLIEKRPSGYYNFIHRVLQHHLAYQYAIQNLNDKTYYAEENFISSPLETLATIKDPRCIPALEKLLDNPDTASFQDQIIDLIAQIAKEKALPMLLSALSHENHEVKISAAEKLRENPAFHNNPEVKNTLVALLQNTDESVRAAAAIALATSGDERTIPYLIEITKSNTLDRNTITEVIKTLATFKDERVYQYLIELINRPADTKRVHIRVIAALWGLGIYGDQRAIPHILPFLFDTYEPIYTPALEALKQLGNIETVHVLLNMLEEQTTTAPDKYNYWKVQDAISNISQRHSEEIIPIMMKSLQHKKPEIRLVGIQVLGDMKHQEAVTPLIKLLNDTEGTKWERVCDVAVQALDKIGTEEAIEVVTKWRKHQYNNLDTFLD